MSDHGPGPMGTIGLYASAAAIVVALLLLSGCGEPASCWSEHRATFRPCDEVRIDQINREIDKRERDR